VPARFIVTIIQANRDAEGEHPATDTSNDGPHRVGDP
jgi:hypothetical protein